MVKNFLVDESFNELILPQLNSRGFTINYYQIIQDYLSDKLIIDDTFEFRRWSTGLLNMQGRVIDETAGVVHVVGRHEAYANIPMQINCSAPNTQAIPKWCRDYLVAPTGRRFVALDIGSAEPRALAGVADDEKLRSAISEGLYESIGMSLLKNTDIELPRKMVKRLFMGYLFGQSLGGVITTLAEISLDAGCARQIFQELQGLFPKSATFLQTVSLKNFAYLQGQYTDIDVSDKRRNQRRSYAASSIVAALVKRWAVRLSEMHSDWWVHEIPRDALWLSVPKQQRNEDILVIARKSLKMALTDCQFEGFPFDDKVITLKGIGA
ncbi:hypothetical protein FOL01_1550 [Weissella jogaejeotgali]|uniref:Uncharacterized protein n=1 Tax=Weissella jogaejeotgali TaxID=1631871 RepID=A0A1L6RCW9_9LACO|nr:hypothetical protein [Weissella jogaejeotgali]APS42409.1 hypothetical protein FOL01_1550 [Weissella jogaejeotgali]